MIAILQARLGSTRLPGKGLFSFFGQHIVERAISIAQSAEHVDRVVLATGDRPENLAMQSYVANTGAEFLVGSEDDVLSRFCQALEGYDGEYCLRITCDNYLAQPAVIDGLFEAAKAENADYAYIAPLSHFSGEIVRCDALRECYAGDHSPEAKEHVTWDIRNSDVYKRLALPSNFYGIEHQKRITLDTLEDLLTMKSLEANYPELESIGCLESVQKLTQTL